MNLEEFISPRFVCLWRFDTRTHTAGARSEIKRCRCPSYTSTHNCSFILQSRRSTLFFFCFHFASFLCFGYRCNFCFAVSPGQTIKFNALWLDDGERREREDWAVWPEPTSLGGSFAEARSFDRSLRGWSGAGKIPPTLRWQLESFNELA